ncbi:MAG: hypothetical protein KAS59_01380, partial [Alphaproteobacteria bacterium]|nr:hypothetical protein [Alphaproteobacteria bacterium]
MSKKTNWIKSGIIFVILSLTAALTIADDLPGIKWLKEVMDEHHNTYAVYKDFGSAGNNFSKLGRFGTATNMTVEGDHTNSLHTGISNNLSCIKVTYVPTTAEEYVGWYYLNGASTSGIAEGVVNWGTIPDAGVNLTGSTNITFWAKGATGLEKVTFIALGVGRNYTTGAPTMSYCGSSPQVTTGEITLSSSWTKYSISLSDKDLSYVLGGFGWVISKPAGSWSTKVFYIDQIEYNGMNRSNEPRLLTSYKSIISDNDIDVTLRNTAFTYDSCLAVLAFLAVGEYERARNIVDALVYVQNNDRYYDDGRIRNAYQGGNLALAPGWLVNGRAGCARIPGYWGVTNTNTGGEGWIEDRFAVSTDTGNIAWTMLTYITAYNILKDQKYLDAAVKMGDWVQTNNAVSNDLHIEYSLNVTTGGGYTTNLH